MNIGNLALLMIGLMAGAGILFDAYALHLRSREHICNYRRDCLPPPPPPPSPEIN